MINAPRGQNKRWQGIYHNSLPGLAGPLPGNVLNEFNCLAQTLEIEQVLNRRRWRGLARSSIICPTHGDSNMLPIWQTNNNIRVNSSANTEDLDPLSTKWVIGLSNGYESRRRLGRSGSLL
jgi:hypothetical protein